MKIKDLIGIDLSVDRQYTSSQYLEYKVVGTHKRMCGNNAMPSTAGKVMERYR